MTRASRKTLLPPQRLYTAAQAKRLDRLAIEAGPLSGFELMQKAGREAFRVLVNRWPQTQGISLVCGAGNNGGDGYVVAQLAKSRGLDVQLVSLVDPAGLRHEAREAWQLAQAAGVTVERWGPETVLRGEVIVDGVLGIGLSGQVRDECAQAIESINAHHKPVLALDIPSGLCSDTGQPLGPVVKASATVSFIGLKRGLVTGQAANYCGELVVTDLGVAPSVFAQVPVRDYVARWQNLRHALAARQPAAHKGTCGHLLIVGGNRGMAGATLLAGEAGLRTGAGLVSLATLAEHVTGCLARRPELMVTGVRNGADLEPLLARATVVVIGPGLGKDSWAEQMLQKVLEVSRIRRVPLVLDADALNLLATRQVEPRNNWVLTPHPGEAARLLGVSVAEIEADRYQAARRLQQKYGGAVVLKGAGTLVAQTCDDASFATSPEVLSPAVEQSEAIQAEVWVVGEANPGMASAGMGDVLSGILGALIAQKVDHRILAPLGVALHQEAGVVARGHKGVFAMLATDVIEALAPVLMAQHA